MLAQRGINVSLYEGISKGEKDFSVLIVKLQQVGIDFVYHGGYHPEIVLILRQSLKKGLLVTLPRALIKIRTTKPSPPHKSWPTP